MNATHYGTSGKTGNQVGDATRNVDQLWKIVNNLLQKIGDLERRLTITMSKSFEQKIVNQYFNSPPATTRPVVTDFIRIGSWRFRVGIDRLGNVGALIIEHLDPHDSGSWVEYGSYTI